MYRQDRCPAQVTSILVDQPQTIIDDQAPSIHGYERFAVPSLLPLSIPARSSASIVIQTRQWCKLELGGLRLCLCLRQQEAHAQRCARQAKPQVLVRPDLFWPKTALRSVLSGLQIDRGKFGTIPRFRAPRGFSHSRQRTSDSGHLEKIYTNGWVFLGPDCPGGYMNHFFNLYCVVNCSLLKCSTTGLDHMKRI